VIVSGMSFQVRNDEICICPIGSNVLETFSVFVVFFRRFVSAVYLWKMLHDVPAKPRDLPVHYQMKPIKFYMYRPYEEGRRRYYVVPESLADSVMKDFHLTKSKNFFRRTDSILQSSKTFRF
jgi:hypothetical protein